MQTPNGSTVQSHETFASLLASSAHGNALRHAGATKDIAVVSELQQAPEQSVQVSVGRNAPKP